MEAFAIMGMSFGIIGMGLAASAFTQVAELKEAIEKLRVEVDALTRS